MKWDENIVKMIQAYIDNAENDIINSVCFVAKAIDARLSSHQKYIFSEILKIYGKDVAENIVCIITSADADSDKPPLVTVALTDDDSPFKDCLSKIKGSYYYQFNN